MLSAMSSPAVSEGTTYLHQHKLLQAPAMEWERIELGVAIHLGSLKGIDMDRSGFCPAKYIPGLLSVMAFSSSS